MDKIERIKELIIELNEASKVYYNSSKLLITDKQWGAKFDELKKLESETGIIYSNSPTYSVGYEVKSELTKVQHKEKMLSLDKTKEIFELKKFLGDKIGVLSWKLDGLTIVMTYDKGIFQSAVTRGNGEIGTDVTHIARTIVNLPQRINYKGKLVVRGECLMKYSDFNKINVNGEYQNPRNLASGTLMLLDANIAKDRRLHWFAFNLVEVENVGFYNSFEKQLEWLQKQGFETVGYRVADRNNIEYTVKWFKDNISKNDFPSDGLVLVFDDLKYRDSLGSTLHHPLGWYAYKWQDSTVETTLRDIQFQVGRTGVLTPVAIFDEIEIEGSMVSKASLHNISILKSLELGIGDIVTVYKANMIIPQIDDNLTRSNIFKLPTECPECHGKVEIKQTDNAEFLVCTNPNCKAKLVQKISHAVKRDCLNVDGLSESTIEKFIDKGFIKDIIDLYRLSKHKDEIVHMEGFGLKSYNNLIKSIETSKKVKLENLLFALGIPNVGKSTSRDLAKFIDNDITKLFGITSSKLVQMKDCGEITANSISDYFNDEENINMIDKLIAYRYIVIEEEKKQEVKDNPIKDKVFVVTGDVFKFKNRKELQEKIELLGGKVTGSVSAKTNYLINNDINSVSSKNKKAKELNIPIITEDEFLEMIK